MEPVVSAFKIEFHRGTLSREEMGEALSGYLTSVARALQDAGCPLIGHIKLMLSGEGGGYLMANLTSFFESPSVTGSLEGEIGMGTLTVHAVVYGTEKELLEDIFKNSLKESIPSLLLAPGHAQE